MNNKNNSKIEKKPKPKPNSKTKANPKSKPKLKIKKKSGGVGNGEGHNTITETKLVLGLQIYYTDDYKFIIDYIKYKTDTVLDPPPKQTEIDQIKNIIKANSSTIHLLHKVMDHRLILMIQNTETNETELQKFYDKLCEILKGVKHKIYIFLPFFCNNVLYPANVHAINKKKLVNLDNEHLIFFDIDKIFSILEGRPGALVFGRSDASYSSDCKNLTTVREDMLSKVINAIKTGDVNNIKTKPKDYDNVVRINMPQTYNLGTPYQMSMYNQQQTSIPSNMIQTRYLNKYGVDKTPQWNGFYLPQLGSVKQNGPPNDNVLILGDSWSAGYYINSYNQAKDSDFLARPVLLHSNKNIYYPDGGAFGYTSRDLLSFLINKSSRNYAILKEYLQNHVGIVVLFIGINDRGNDISLIETEENKTEIKRILRGFKNINKILDVKYPKNLRQFPNQYSNISSSIMGAPMVNSAPVSRYHKYGKEIAEGIKSLEHKSAKESTLQLKDLQPGDLSIKDHSKLHLSTDSEISMYRRVGGKNNKKQKYEKYKTKEVLGKKRQIFRKKDSKSKKEYIKHKNAYRLVKDYIKLKKSARK